jgi:catechol 2,3-dioxygenase-like lactoylglutathione lyase family enzyme
MRLDGVRIGAADVPDAAARYATLLGVEPVDGADGRRRFQLERGAVEIEPGEPGLRAVCFVPEGADDRWPEDRDAYHGVDVAIVPPRAAAATARAADAAIAIDHVVVFTPSPERAIALWRDRLGLRLAFDREFPERRLRLVFLRSGGMTLELACALPAPAEAGPDRLYGVSYRVPDLASRRATLLAAGVDVSDIRPGHKAGTRVASVKSGTADVPTLLLEAEPR